MKPDGERRRTTTTTTTTTTTRTGGGGGNAKMASNFIGRHRLQAALSHVDQQIRVFQDELNELDSIDGPSTVCNDLITGVESTPDPLLPQTRGPLDVTWERWFGGGNTSRTHRRWI